MARREHSEMHRKQRGKNYAVLGVLLGVVAVFYLVYVVRAGLFG